MIIHSNSCCNVMNWHFLNWYFLKYHLLKHFRPTRCFNVFILFARGFPYLRIRKWKLYSGLLKIRTRMCKDFWWKSGFFGKVLFLRESKVRIFRKNAIFSKTQNYELANRRSHLDPSNGLLRFSRVWPIQYRLYWTFEKTINQSQEIRKMCFSPQNFDKFHVGQIISPDFLDKPCLAKTQKSGFFGVRILSKPL